VATPHAGLDRVALNQTRLRTPGLRLDAKGVALGAKGLVLLPTLDRLVTLLAVHTSHASLQSLIGSLSIDIVKSSLGHREVVIRFDADGTDRMDQIAESARLAGGFTFTGSGRHFVQYRDAGAPFGYDVRQITPNEAQLSLSHSQFEQQFAIERAIGLGSLLLKLEPRLAPDSVDRRGGRWLCTERGLGAALIHYFVRSQVDADVGVAQWPPASAFDELPVERYLFRLEAIPDRMLNMLRTTPGIDIYSDVAPGCAVELGYEHPVNLRACPVFDKSGLVLLRGGGTPPLVMEKMPQLGAVAAFAAVKLHDHEAHRATSDGVTQSVQVPLRVQTGTRAWRSIVATRIRREELGVLRLIAYRLSQSQLRRTLIALTSHGAFLFSEQGIDSVPIGELFSRVHEHVFVSAGYRVVPDVAPDVLFTALGSPANEFVFINREGQRIGVDKESFVTLEQALLTAEQWQHTTAEQVARVVATQLPILQLESVGLRPMRDLESLE